MLGGVGYSILGQGFINGQGHYFILSTKDVSYMDNPNMMYC